MRGIGVVRIVAAVAGAALLVPAVGSSSELAPRLPKPKVYVYDVQVTGAHDTRFINGGCDPYCGTTYQGSHTWTQTFRSVRVTVDPARAVHFSPGSRVKGTSVERYDHGSNFCEHETPTVTRQPELMFVGFGGTFDLMVQAGGSGTGDPVVCQAYPEPVLFAGRVGGSIVTGMAQSGFTRLDVEVGTTRTGPGFPLNRLAAGKGFTIALQGRSLLRREKEQLETTKTAFRTTGSVRIVFTPRTRAMSAVGAPSLRPRTRAMSTVAAASSTAAKTCQKTYNDSWSAKERACFLITAYAQWTQTERWTHDVMGSECEGSLTTKMRWTTAPSLFWVGTTFPDGFYGNQRVRTQNFIHAAARGTVERQAIGGARVVGCVPQLTNDCGKKPAMFPRVGTKLMRGAGGSFAVQPQGPYPIAPFQACGALAGETIGLLPRWGGAYITVPPMNDEDLVKRLLALPVGGSLVLRGTGGQPRGDQSSVFSETGSFTGRLVFKRMQ